jgi:hypothetical protein
MTLNCPARGTPSPTIVWLRNGQLLGTQNDTGHFILVSGGKQLKIDSADFNHNGSYSCIATNAAGAADLDMNVRVIGLFVRIRAINISLFRQTTLFRSTARRNQRNIE